MDTEGVTGLPFDLPLQSATLVAEQGARRWEGRFRFERRRPKGDPQEVRLREVAPPAAAWEWNGLRSLVPSADAGEPPRSANLVVARGERPGAQTVVFVHGIGNKPPGSILKCQWDTALFGREMGDRTRMAYWVNRERYPEPLRTGCQSPDRLVAEDDEATTATIMALGARGVPLRGREREEEAIDREVMALSEGDPDREATLRALAGQLLQAPREVPVEEPRPVRPGEPGVRFIPRIVRDVFTGLATRVFLRDVNDFLFDEARRRRMTDALWDRLRGGGGPFVVVAHSQGSMVAYELLRQLPPDEFPVELFLTIGSPLGLPTIASFFRQRNGRELRTPECVGRWVNVADRLDPVSLDPRLRDEYRANSSGVEVEDQPGWWVNIDSPADPHSATGYLSSERVRAAVRSVVGNAFGQFVAGSRIARDVSAEMEDAEPEDLRDVLIQLADSEGKATPRSLDEVADTIVARLGALAEGRRAPTPPFEPPDRMRRFLQVQLTRAEIEALRSLSEELHIKQVWNNATKRALVEVSAATVQATPANLGYGARGQGIGWAVLDTGIDASHPHFGQGGRRTVTAQWDCLGRGDPKELDGDGRHDPHGHGTHVAGIIAGWTDHLSATAGGPKTRLAGMAPEATLYGFRVLRADGSGSDASIIKALDHVAAINEGASRLLIHGVNLSLGSSFDPSIYGCGHTPLCQELRRLWRQGVLVVVAAGNEGYAMLQTRHGLVGSNIDLSIGDPANLEEAIAVGSVHRNNPHTYGISYFSSRGPTADGRRKPDLVAPGEKILSALAGARPSARDAEKVDHWYVEDSGTSMAAPHVSGVLAAYLSVRREFIGEPDRVKRILLDNCTDLGRDPNMQGAGLVNLVKMLIST
ncbi:S8 family peptidase [Sabulicella glaciei]|uniref:S8 family peptidase n=1 Tax=Sabulicella glaciei TaxID=2984948 RepID=A0ABT3P2P9_9PROT|nr:S8 family peptidase [Roseococcus sp. MDT2-1-1]MCW8088463.1 S8 family peptidase [Roseococcus sp. MDT2-1-1]